jgi:selenocysteine-specific elongation factor
MNSFIIIGTAGHVDHGKTQLVRALTGIDTDRLKEEQERGISIELGFAPLKLSEGITAGIVDVPGHERFVKNMLAGAGGIDLVILVVAADEGVMPQTEEHLDILELLHVQKAVVVITKVDLVDEEWLLLVEDDVRKLLESTRFSDAPVIPVSVVTGEGLNELRAALEKKAKEVVPKRSVGDARLPVDRVFTITGFGTVLTGTLFSGSLHSGDIMEIQPSGLKGRVRSLQVHGKKVDEVQAGQRVAVNLTGVEVNQVQRGDVLVTPGVFPVVQRITASLYLLKRSPHPLKNWQRIRFHLGTKETFGRVRLLDREQLQPGDNAPVQLELEEKVVAVIHDRFVIRQYSPMTTIGGGEIIEVGGKRYKRFHQDVLAGLERKLTGTPSTRVAEELRSVKSPLSLSDLTVQTGLEEKEVCQILDELQDDGEILLLDCGGELFAVPISLYEDWLQEVQKNLIQYHRQFPLRGGYPKEELRSRHFKFLSTKLYQELLERWAENGEIIISGQNLSMPDFSIRLTPDQENMIRRARESLMIQPFSPPGSEELLQHLANDLDLLKYCLQQKMIVKVGEDLYFDQDAVERAWDILSAYLNEHGEIAVAKARDLLGTSRRYCLSLLEYFDRSKKTRRVGDMRVLFRG